VTQNVAGHLPPTHGPKLPVTVVAVPADESPRVYTIVEAAQLLRVPEGWLRKKVTAGLVPHTRLGKHVRFTDAHLCRIVASGEQSPTTHAPIAVNGLSPRARRPQQ
jgi:excisionase family DNA binding protein